MSLSVTMAGLACCPIRRGASACVLVSLSDLGCMSLGVTMAGLACCPIRRGASWGIRDLSFAFRLNVQVTPVYFGTAERGRASGFSPPR